jgi:hypothetical protein
MNENESHAYSSMSKPYSVARRSLLLVQLRQSKHPGENSLSPIPAARASTPITIRSTFFQRGNEIDGVVLSQISNVQTSTTASIIGI